MVRTVLAAGVLGNTVVGRFADRHTLGVVLTGPVLNAGFLTGFALLAQLPVPAVVFMMGIGLVGIIIATSLGGPLIGAYGLHAPLWLGSGMALLGIATVLPALVRRTERARVPECAVEPVQVSDLGQRSQRIVQHRLPSQLGSPHKAVVVQRAGEDRDAAALAPQAAVGHDGA